MGLRVTVCLVEQASPTDVGDKALGGRAPGLDGDRFLAQVIEDELPAEGFHAAGFQGDGEKASHGEWTWS